MKQNVGPAQNGSRRLAALPRPAASVQARTLASAVRVTAPARSPLRSDEEIVRTVVAGTAGDYEELIRRHQKPLVNFLFRMVGDFELALDMAQEVFTKAYFALPRYDERFRFTTWLYRIASNNAIDHLRRHRPPTISLDQPHRVGEGEVSLELPSPAPSPVEELEYHETSRRIQKAIGRLPASYRQLLLLRHVHQLRYDEIADVASLPLGTVKNRIFRARLLLRRLMDEPVARAGRPAPSRATPTPPPPPPRRAPAAREA